MSLISQARPEKSRVLKLLWTAGHPVLGRRQKMSHQFGEFFFYIIFFTVIQLDNEACLIVTSVFCVQTFHQVSIGLRNSACQCPLFDRRKRSPRPVTRPSFLRCAFFRDRRHMSLFHMMDCGACPKSSPLSKCSGGEWEMRNGQDKQKPTSDRANEQDHHHGHHLMAWASAFCAAINFWQGRMR